MKSMFLCVFLSLSGVWFNSSIHDFHFSNTIINLNTDLNTLEISSHVFVDDLEKALSAFDSTEIKYSAEQNTKLDGIILRYFLHNLSFKNEDTELNYSFIGSEYSEDLSAVWVYLESESLDLATTTNLKVQNKLLMEIYDDQKNILNFKGVTSRQYHLFETKSQNETLNLSSR